VDNRRKTKLAAAQLDLQPVYSKKLLVGDKKKAGIFPTYFKEITFPDFVLLFMSPYFNNYYNIQGIIRHFCILFPS